MPSVPIQNKIRLSKTGECIAITAIFLAIRTLTPMIRLGHVNRVAVLVVTLLIMMLVQLGLVRTISRLEMKPSKSGLWALLSGAVVVGLLMHGIIKPGVPIIVIRALVGVHQLSLVLFAVFLGVTISYIIRERSILLPVVIVAALVDFWNVYIGPLGHIVATKPAIVKVVTIQMPAPVPGMPVPMIGMGDFVFLALYFSVIYRFGMNARGTFWLGYGLLTATMLIVIGFTGAAPALVPMAVAVIGANARLFKLKREELLATVYVGLIVLAGIVVAVAVRHR